AEDGIRAATVTGVQTCALPISRARSLRAPVTPLLRPPDVAAHRRAEHEGDGSARPGPHFRAAARAPPRADSRARPRGSLDHRDRSEERRVGKEGWYKWSAGRAK